MPDANNSNCIFCRIAAGEALAHIVAENDLCLAILDINPFTRGHCLVIPRRHVQWWHEMTPEETASFFLLARDVANRLMKAFKPDFVAQYARGRRIPHTHLFLVPAYPGDLLDRFFSALEYAQENPGGMVAIRQQEALAEAAGLIASAGSD